MDTKMEAVQESIKLALDAADAATDVTSEYNKVKKAHALLEAKVKQIHKYTTVVFLSSIISGLVVIVVSAFLFMQSSDKLTNMTETSREALVVFAENVDGVNASLKNLDTAIKKQGDLLAINEKLVVTLDKIEKRVEKQVTSLLTFNRRHLKSQCQRVNMYCRRIMNDAPQNFLGLPGRHLHALSFVDCKDPETHAHRPIAHHRRPQKTETLLYSHEHNVVN